MLKEYYFKAISSEKLLLFSACMLVLFAGVGLCMHSMEAEAIAEKLAPVLNVDEGLLRQGLEAQGRANQWRRGVLLGGPWAVMCLLLAGRAISDMSAQRKQVPSKTLMGPSGRGGLGGTVEKE